MFPHTKHLDSIDLHGNFGRTCNGAGGGTGTHAAGFTCANAGATAFFTHEQGLGSGVKTIGCGCGGGGGGSGRSGIGDDLQLQPPLRKKAYCKRNEIKLINQFKIESDNLDWTLTCDCMHNVAAIMKKHNETLILNAG